MNRPITSRTPDDPPASQALGKHDVVPLRGPVFSHKHVLPDGWKPGDPTGDDAPGVVPAVIVHPPDEPQGKYVLPVQGFSTFVI